MGADQFPYNDERFADIQLLRYCLNGIESLTTRQKELVYYLTQATLFGRDITFDQFGRYNLRIRKVLETIYTDLRIDHTTPSFRSLALYLKRVWFSSGIYHHYASEKFTPGFTPDYLLQAMRTVDARRLPLNDGQTVDELFSLLQPVIFSPDVLPKRVNKADGDDLVATSACHFYEGVSQAEAEAYYAELKRRHADHPRQAA